MKAARTLRSSRPTNPEHRLTAAAVKAELDRLQEEAEIEAAAERMNPREDLWAGSSFFNTLLTEEEWLDGFPSEFDRYDFSSQRLDDPWYRLLHRIDEALASPSIRLPNAAEALISNARDKGRGVHRALEFAAQEDLEHNLIRHVEDLLAGGSRLLAKWDAVEPRLGSWRARERMRSDLDGPSGTDRTRLVCLFASFWVRSPETWEPGSGRSLEEHLLAVYEVPVWLHACWKPGQLEHQLKFICWFILLAQGGSLKRVGRELGWNIPPGFIEELHSIRQVPCGVACMIAEVHRLGGGARVINALTRSEVLVVDPTEFRARGPLSRTFWSRAGLPIQDEFFWRSTVMWLIRNIDQLEPEQSNWVLRWAVHAFREGQRAGGAPFRWRGRSVRAVLEQARVYRRLFELPAAAQKWEPHGWEWSLEAKPGRRWTFEELTTGVALHQEGLALKHCVSGYALRCVSGDSAIVALRLNGDPWVTIEIDPRTGRIVQAQGRLNRRPMPDELRVIEQWHREQFALRGA